MVNKTGTDKNWCQRYYNILFFILTRLEISQSLSHTEKNNVFNCTRYKYAANLGQQQKCYITLSQ